MQKNNPYLETLALELARLPGVGKRNAQRMAVFVVFSGEDYPKRLASAVVKAAQNVGACRRCGAISTKGEECAVCSNPLRRAGSICVVESVADMSAIEESGSHNGLYHVLHGNISPLDGRGPEDINVKTLFDRVKAEKIEEVILATEPTVEGDATAHYIADILSASNPDILVTRIATGLPKGANLEFTDRRTIENAIKLRQKF